MSKLLATTVGAQTVVQAGDTITNIAVATLFASTVTLPANDLRTLGRVLEWHAAGLFDTDVGGHNIKLDLMADTTVLATTGTFTPTLAGAGGKGWHLWAETVCTTVGAGGAVETHGMLFMYNTAVVADAVFLPSAATTPLDTTVAHTLAIRITWATASVNNSITQRELVIDLTGDRG